MQPARQWRWNGAQGLERSTRNPLSAKNQAPCNRVLRPLPLLCAAIQTSGPQGPPWPAQILGLTAIPPPPFSICNTSSSPGPRRVPHCVTPQPPSPPLQFILPSTQQLSKLLKRKLEHTLPLFQTHQQFSTPSPWPDPCALC